VASGSFRVTVYPEEATRLARQHSLVDRVDVAEQVADEARADAPVRTGEYRGGIGVETDGTLVRVVDNDPEAGFKEYGTADTPAHASLTNAARRHGKYSGVQPKGR
jgi:hypothetical protein